MADIGSTLREARMREKIDITTVESATKIRAKYLRALENEEWDLMPGPTFVRTFLRTYADYLGLDSKMLVEDYKQRFERPGPQDMLPFSARAGGGGRRARQQRGVPPWVVLAACVALLLVALFALGSLGGGDDDPEVAATPTPTQTASPKKKSSTKKKRKSRAEAVPKVVALKILPEALVNVCLEGAGGKVLIRSQDLEDPTETFRSKRMRVTFGNGMVRMRIASKSYGVPDTDSAVGFELRPGKQPEPLPEDDLPTCL